MKPDAVAVIGLGPLGQLSVQYARVVGAREVIAIDTVPARLERARAHGATETLCMPAGEAVVWSTTIVFASASPAASSTASTAASSVSAMCTRSAFAAASAGVAATRTPCFSSA